jgi:hypothetical protein
MSGLTTELEKLTIKEVLSYFLIHFSFLAPSRGKFELMTFIINTGNEWL